MRTYNHLYKNPALLDEFVQDMGISDHILIRVHSAIHRSDEMNELLARVRKLLPKAVIIGCSTMQVIIDGKIVPDACLISFSVFERAELFSVRVPCMRPDGSWYEGEEVADRLLSHIPRDRKGFMLTFFPCTYSKIESFVERVNASHAPVRMLGGACFLEDAESIREHDRSYVIEGDSVSLSDLAVAYIDASELNVYGNYICGVEAVGKKSPVSCTGRYIDTVDGTPAAAWYSSMVGADELEADPSLAETFPIVMSDEREIAYHVEYLHNPDKGPEEPSHLLRTLGELNSSNRISPGYFNPRKIYDQMCGVLEDLLDRPIETLFFYDCQARSLLLHDCARWEVSHFATTNMSGALLGGEVTFRGKENFYANFTFVGAALSESDRARVLIDIPDPSSIQGLQEENVQMLNYLLMNANKHLSDELSLQHSRIKDAVFHNPATGTDNQLKYLFERSQLGLNKVGLLYLNNEKMLRLFSGQSETYDFLSTCYRRLQEKYQDRPLRFYSYHDSSLLIAASAGFAEEDFEQIITEMQNDLNGRSYEDVTLSYTAITIQGDDDLFNQLEAALEYAARNKRTRVRYDEITDDLEKEHENIHMLWIIREALIHKRVKPYFQMIRNNLEPERPLFEALIRIEDENGKIYFPDQFLPVSKEYGIYDKLSELMVRTVMEKFYHREVRVSINLSVQDIYNRSMLKMIFDLMKKAPHPSNYVFEIIETEQIVDYEYIQSFADRIHEYGGKIAIDDFGSGFSNLLHILRIGADYIKIDGEVIKSITTDPLCRYFIEFMNSWCRKAKQALVCEYIENAEIQQIMEEIGVKYSQGYYFSRPHPWGEEDEKLVAKA